jgi:NAD(P)-dependent dehydrogenase (short-subunit alcohol dehydrogenase family)
MTSGSSKRVVVVGASTGLGRCIATGLSHRGSSVSLLARRLDKLEQAAAEAHDSAHVFVCDAVDEASAKVAIDAAASAMGGIDTVIYAPAVGPLTRLADATPAQWMDTFATNVVGANNITQAALPHLTGSAGNMIYMSTTGASYTGPWQGMGLYQITKAALNRLADHWRVEQPGLNFTLVTIGECPGGQGDRQTQFNADWDSELVGQVAADWFARQYLSGAFIDVEHLVDQFHSLVTMGQSLQVPSMVIIPRPPIPSAGRVAPINLGEMDEQVSIGR